MEVGLLLSHSGAEELEVGIRKRCRDRGRSSRFGSRQSEAREVKQGEPGQGVCCRAIDGSLQFMHRQVIKILAVSVGVDVQW